MKTWKFTSPTRRLYNTRVLQYRSDARTVVLTIIITMLFGGRTIKYIIHITHTHTHILLCPNEHILLFIYVCVCELQLVNGYWKVYSNIIMPYSDRLLPRTRVPRAVTRDARATQTDRAADTVAAPHNQFDVDSTNITILL